MFKISGCSMITMSYKFIFYCGYVHLIFFILTFTSPPACNCQGFPKLLFSDRKDIRRIDLANGNKNTVTLISGLTQTTSIDFLYILDRAGRDRTIYCWTDSFDGIFCATSPNLDSSRKIVSVDYDHAPEGLAIDWVTQKLYWVDSDAQTVEVCELRDGGDRKVLYYDKIHQPKQIMLDPLSGYMYWTNWGDEPKIERAGMNGDPATRSTIVAKRISWITIDYVERTLLWVDSQLNHIYATSLDGGNRTVVKKGSTTRNPRAITVYEDKLYWTDWRRKSIFTCNKSDCSRVSTVQSNLYYPMDIKVFQETRHATIANPCAVNNGGCSHLCLLSPAGGADCACPTGTLLNEDGVTCADVHEMIFLARRSDLRKISLDTSDYTDAVIKVNGISHAIAIDFDPVDRYIYWTDDEIRSIQRAKMDGSDQQTIVEVEVLNPDGIAIDWVSRNIFWTDTGSDRIEVARLDGSSRRVIISDELDEPRAIVVDPVNGMIYWTDWGTHAKIEKAAMDGSMRQVVISEDLKWPNGIALDFEYMRLYWADAYHDKIERANLDGSDRTVMVDIELPHVFGLGVTGKFIYWTDWQRRTIERVDKLTPGLPRQLIIDQLPDLMSIRTLAMKPNSSFTNGCAGNNGMCSHLCLNTPDGVVCACPMGLELLSDNRTCIVPEAFLLFSQRKRIKRASMQYAHRDTTLPIQHLQNITALDIDIGKELLYFSDNVNGTIRHACVNGSAVSVVLEFNNKESPAAMVVDWISNNLYFIDGNKKVIEVYNIRTKTRKVIVWNQLGDPRNLGLHPAKGYLYWTDWDFEGRPVIGRANLDGSDQRFILSSIGRCGSINIDMEADRIYWVNYDKKSIQSAGLNGEDIQTIKFNLEAPLSVNTYGQYVYWYDITDKVIRRVSKVNSTDEAIIQTDINSLINLLVVHGSSQKGVSNCMSNNGGCQYFCFSAGKNRQATCGCPTHFLLNRDKMTCSAPTNFLLLSERTDPDSKDMQIKQILDSTMPDLVLPMGSLRSIKSLEFDLLRNKLYWIVDTSKFKAIRRSALDGTDLEVFLHSDLFTPTSMAIDPYSRVLFWTDAESHVINVTALDRGAVGVIYRDSVNNPVSVAIGARKGYLFFITAPDTQSGDNKVLRTNLDGTNIQLVAVGESIAALEVDQERDSLYYSETGTLSIKSCSFDGDNVRTLVRDASANKLTIYNDKLYYTQDSTKLFYVDKISGRNKKQIMRGENGISDVHAVNGDALILRPNHPCTINNGDCSHICYTDPNGLKKCGCPEGLELHVNKVSCKPTPTCKPTELGCSTGNGQTVCIPQHWRCDGSEECADGSDEKNCPKCPDSEFSCGSGECIERSRVCNKIADCKDSSDEKKCCNADQFMCVSSSTCIPKNKVGDSVYDCTDGSDEPIVAKSSNSYAIGIIVVLCIVSIFIIFMIIFIVCKCHKRSTSLHYGDPGGVTRPVTSLRSLSTGIQDTTLTRISRSVVATTAISASSVTSAGAYDRNHITGASSSSSSMTHLQAGFNPPPSPVTERSAFIDHDMNMDDCSTLVSSAYPTYRMHTKRHRVKVPPTTPISTCDDSEPSMVNYSTQRHRVKRKTNKKYNLLKQTEPQPPPPTPSRSEICSADEGSECPPSPSTVRSFRSAINNPYPPPPSPEPTSDNS